MSKEGEVTLELVKEKKSVPEEKYMFSDIDIFERHSESFESTYYDLTSFEPYMESSLTNFDIDSPYVLEVCHYVVTYKRMHRIGYVACTIDDLLALANLKSNSRTIKQLRSGVDKTISDHIIAIYCAKKISSYNLGKVVKTVDENGEPVFIFYHHKYENKRHIWREVLRKPFRET